MNVGTTLNVEDDAVLGGNLSVPSGSVSAAALQTPLTTSTMLNASNIFAQSIIATNIIGNGSVNGEQPPYVFKMGTPGNNTWWHTNQPPPEIIRDYLGDEDGGRIRFIVQRNDNEEVRTIEEYVAIEQPSDGGGEGVVPGLHGHTYQFGGGTQGFRLGDAVQERVTPSPWDWILVHDFPTLGRDGLTPGSNGEPWQGADKYRIEFLLVPNLSATVIIYDN